MILIFNYVKHVLAVLKAAAGKKREKLENEREKLEKERNKRGENLGEILAVLDNL